MFHGSSETVERIDSGEFVDRYQEKADDHRWHSRRHGNESLNRNPPRTLFADLSSMTFDRLQTLCGSWRPLAEQDSVLVSLMWQAIERHRKLPAAIHGLSAEELIRRQQLQPVDPDRCD